MVRFNEESSIMLCGAAMGYLVILLSFTFIYSENLNRLGPIYKKKLEKDRDWLKSTETMTIKIELLD